MAEWTKWDKRFMDLASTIGTWSSCYQENRHIGAVIVRNKRIITTGYNGAPAGISIEGATIYCTHQPCVICAKMIVNSGISRVIYGEGYPDDFSLQIFSEAGVELLKYGE